jgi:hypothetical protein
MEIFADVVIPSQMSEEEWIATQEFGLKDEYKEVITFK